MTTRDSTGLSTATVPALELRRLLFEIKDLRNDIKIRFRLMGEMWQSHHCRVIQLTDTGAVLFKEKENKLFFVPDLNNVMQFEIDQPFQNFQPHFHYTVDPVLF